MIIMLFPACRGLFSVVLGELKSNFEEELPKLTVGKLSVDSGPSANRQINLTVQTANRQATNTSIRQLLNRQIK